MEGTPLAVTLDFSSPFPLVHALCIDLVADFRLEPVLDVNSLALPQSLRS